MRLEQYFRQKEGEGLELDSLTHCQKSRHTLSPPHPQHKIPRNGEKARSNWIFTNHISCSNWNSKAPSGISFRIGYCVLRFYVWWFQTLHYRGGGRGLLSRIKIKLLAYLTTRLFSGPSTWTYKMGFFCLFVYFFVFLFVCFCFVLFCFVLFFVLQRMCSGLFRVNLHTHSSDWLNEVYDLLVHTGSDDMQES